MRRWGMLWMLVVLLSACNLSNDIPAPTRELILTPVVPTPYVTPANEPTTLPGTVPQPTLGNGVLPTRTPFGNALPINPNPTSLAVPTSATGERAEIDLPIANSSVVAGNLQISGVVSGIASNTFTLQLVDASGNLLNAQAITVQNPNQIADVPWSASMTTGTYLGAAELRLVTQNALNQEIMLARVLFTLVAGGSVNQPAVNVNAGVPNVSILTPPDNGTFAGTVLQVTGLAGGFPTGQFVVALVGTGGTVINSQMVTVTIVEGSTMVPWSVALGTNNYHGAAEIRAFGSSGGSATLDSVPITIQ